MKRYLPWVVCAAFSLYVVITLVRPASSSEGFDISGFGRLPVLMGGRVQPLDTIGRIGLLQIRGTVTVAVEQASSWRFWRPARTLDASEWLLEVMTSPDADTRRIFPIHDARIVRALGLGAAGDAGDYAFKDLAPKLTHISKEAARINKRPATEREDWEREWLRMRAALVVYERLKNSLQPNSFREQPGDAAMPGAYDFAPRLAVYREQLKQGREAMLAREHGKDATPLSKDVEESMRGFAKPFIGVSRVSMIAMVPPMDLSSARDRWETTGTAIVNSARDGQLSPAVSSYAAMSSAYVPRNADAFNAAVRDYRAFLVSRGLGPELSRVRYEHLYNRFQPYVRATALYLVAIVLFALSLWTRSIPLRRSAYAPLSLAFALHTLGLLFEMMVQGRPPGSSVYSLIIAAGWAAVAAVAVVDRLTRRKVAAAAPAAGLVAFIGAHSLAPGGALQLGIAMIDAYLIAAMTVVAIAAVVLYRRDRTSAAAADARYEGGMSTRDADVLVGGV